MSVYFMTWSQNVFISFSFRPEKNKSPLWVFLNIDSSVLPESCSMCLLEPRSCFSSHISPATFFFCSHFVHQLLPRWYLPKFHFWPFSLNKSLFSCVCVLNRHQNRCVIYLPPWASDFIPLTDYLTSLSPGMFSVPLISAHLKNWATHLQLQSHSLFLISHLSQ